MTPENEIKDKYGRDIIPLVDYDTKILIEKTKELANRKWQIIKHFISDNPKYFSGTKTKPMTLDDFFNHCLKSESATYKRMLAEKFVESYPAESW